MKLNAIIVNLIFAGSIIFSQFSGNDKAPYLVIATAALSLLIAIGFALTMRWRAAAIFAIPAMYSGVVIALARLGLIDAQIFLGFR